MFEFDHCYTVDRDHRWLARLEKAGFTLDPKTVEHPGKHLCRFIPFSRPGGDERQYLEFVSKPANQGRKPGLSFGSAVPLERYFARIKKSRSLRPAFEHRNYDWKAHGKTPRRLGWNFVTFGRKLPAAEIWLTEYERPDGKTPRWKKRPTHANGALGVVGLAFEASRAGRRYLERVLARRVDRAFVLPCGTRLALTHARETRFAGVVVKCRSLPRFIRRAKPDEIVVRDGRKTAVFRNPTGAWDVFVV